MSSTVLPAEWTSTVSCDVDGTSAERTFTLVIGTVSSVERTFTL